jgi:phospholipid/cholesterol/gamma-HCH transport system ATP-binding protein
LSTDSIITLTGVSKRFGHRVVLDNVSCQVPTGATTVFVGPSGVGKTVLIKLMVGLLSPDEGQVAFEGHNLRDLPSKELYALRRRMGLLFQDSALFDSMSVFENVAFPLRHHRQMTEREIRDLVQIRLKEVGLGGVWEQLPSELSGGMRKRVGLARALILDPDVIFFDEPTSGLDPVTAAAIDDLIMQTQKRLGTTFVVISHDTASTRRIAHTIGMLYRGRLVDYGRAEAVLHSENPVLRQFFDRSSEGPIQIV